ncbi:MAG: septum formation inhibitor Maf [Nitrospirae bacterium]|nr:septum formation inhibitor Maf [Nitrospirota bacterium]MBI3353140.1 septum formation inhibitor Maf [Nitrospirota bacterium]
MSHHLILASGSPRRKELLSQFGLDFETIFSNIPETEIPGEPHEAFVKRLAALKAEHIANKRKTSFVIGADTIVVLGSKRLGKPGSKEEARGMLESLSGRRHEVLTGVAVMRSGSGFIQVEAERTAVWFKKLLPSEIENYVKTPEPYDKAGSYGIQGSGASFVEKIEGDVTNVIGLPLNRLRRLLEKAGFNFPSEYDRPGLKVQAD